MTQNPKAVLAAALQEKARRLNTNRLKAYRPYAKQLEFHAAGLTKRERALLGANQSGKTIAGSMEEAMHATGIYKPDWPGRKFLRPSFSWCAGITGETTRDNVQRLLLGRAGSEGTGSIPKDNILGWTNARGMPDLVDTIDVKHMNGGVSKIALKSYEKGRSKWQGETLDRVWYDEEPPVEIYTEGLTRTNATGGFVTLTLTPLLGMSDVVDLFYPEPKTVDRHLTMMTIDDVEHYTPEERTRIINSYLPHEREARAYGIPTLGSGRVFPMAEEDIKIDPFDIPKHWTQIGGLDFGWDHPTAAVTLVWDRDADILYVTKEYRVREQTPIIHAGALRVWGEWLPWSWPHDGNQHGDTGEQKAVLYRKNGLKMLPNMATFPEGGNSVEAGVLEMLERMQTGRLKVFSHLTSWFEEFRLYHRKDGKIVKERDDLISATRYAMMMRRFARTNTAKKDLDLEKRINLELPVRGGAGSGWMGR